MLITGVLIRSRSEAVLTAARKSPNCQDRQRQTLTLCLCHPSVHERPFTVSSCNNLQRVRRDGGAISEKGNATLAPPTPQAQVPGGLHPSRRTLYSLSNALTESSRSMPSSPSWPLTQHTSRMPASAPRLATLVFSSSRSMTSMPTPVLHCCFCTYPAWEQADLVAQAPSVESVSSPTQESSVT
ncbi:hypothetical protein OH76DRAFT_899470 [Lentinus brumalis]|uniref:Uncharacterized protein n=1 Tax=Lentinus brumalis TaxID=2498619 RepID=A0A371D0Q2_9APHY|nr:hypothetical protein OH76DRAFT_899470 [Polyporus brumalis]